MTGAEVDCLICFRIVVGPVAMVEAVTFEVIKDLSEEVGPVLFDRS